MTRRLVLRLDARRDIEDASDWYDRERPTLGDDFVGEVDQLLARTLQTPGQFPALMDDVRRGLVRRFPFAVYFVADARHVVVLAVMHLHRHPEAWKRRASQPE